MNFEQTENQKMIADMIRDFAAKEIKPNLMEWDESQHFPVDLFRKMGDLGLMGILVPTEYGGSGFGYFEYITAIVEVSKVCGSIGLSMAAHNSLCTGHIMAFGNEEQKQKYLPKLATGEWIGAWGLTETGTGSDAGDAISGDVAVVIVRTGEKGDSRGMTAFIVEKGTPGFSGGKKENKLGMRASETACLFFDDCRIPAANMLGNEGEGFIQAMKVLDGGRISIASLGIGIAKGAYEAALQYSKEREQFGKPIGHFQAIGFKLADMATKIECSELLTYQAAYLKNIGKPMTKESAMAKYHSSETSVEVSTDAVQIFGGYGYTKDYPVEKFYRDSKLCTIGEGTSEIQKLVISRHLLK